MPFQDGWLTTMKGMRLLVEETSKLGLLHVSPRHINQDALENLFGLIRSHCGCNDHPTVGHFISALKTCIINGLAHSDILLGKNCESDNASVLCRLKSFICGNAHQPNSGPVTDNVNSDEPVSTLNPATSKEERCNLDFEFNNVGTAYVAGYVARRVLRGESCDVCISLLMTSDPDLFLHASIACREYSPDHQRLTYPSRELVKSVEQGVGIVEATLDARRDMDSVVQTIRVLLTENVDFEWLNGKTESMNDSESESGLVSGAIHNSGHRCALKYKIIQGIIKICVPWWCKKMNRIVDARRKERMKKLRKYY